MTTAHKAPPGIDLPALQRYFTRHVPGHGGPLHVELITGGKSNLTYLVSDATQRWVLRRPPLGPLTPTAHDMAREFRVVAALRGTTVPVAEAVALCEDTSVLGVPFTVVSYVDGWILRDGDDAAALPDERAHRCALSLVRTLAGLHAIPFADVGLGDFGRPDGYLQRQLRRWHGQWGRVATRELPDVDTLFARLGEVVPQRSESSIVHGDYRLDNTIVDRADPTRIVAVVDWEMSTIGDPLSDLGLLLTYWDPISEPVLGLRHVPSANPGFPTADNLAEAYAVASGRDLRDLGFYRALGYAKLAVIAEGIHQRYLAGETVGGGFDAVGSAVPALVSAGHSCLGRTR